VNQNHLQATVLNVPLSVNTLQTSAYDNNIGWQIGNKMPTCRTGHNSQPHSAVIRPVTNRPTPRLRSTTLTRSDHNNVERHALLRACTQIHRRQPTSRYPINCSAPRKLTHKQTVRSTHTGVVNSTSTQYQQRRSALIASLQLSRCTERFLLIAWRRIF